MKSMHTLIGLSMLTVACGIGYCQQHVIVRKPPPGRGLMAPNNGGIWTWGNEILVMYVNGPHKKGPGCGSHSTQEGAPGTTYDTSRSLDGGVTWGDHRIAFERYTARCGWPNPQPVRLTKPLNFRNADTIVHFQRDDAGKTCLYISTDRGRSWSGPYNNIPKFKNGVSGRTNYEVTGPLSLTAYMEMADTSVPGCSRYPSHAVRTTDGGLTWRLGPEISSLTPCGQGKRVEWDTHPSVARIDDNTLIASFRSGNEGDTWSETITLRDDAYGWDTGYPIATVRADGKIVVCYWMKTVDQNQPNYIAATIWDAANVNTKSSGL
jgi:hypothetical protein